MYMEYMRIAENYPAPKSDKKAISRGVQELFSKHTSFAFSLGANPTLKGGVA
jgi:hypothetical protein